MQDVTGRVATSLHGEAGDTMAGTDLGSLAVVQPCQAHLAFLPLQGEKRRVCQTPREPNLTHVPTGATIQLCPWFELFPFPLLGRSLPTEKLPAFELLTPGGTGVS